MDERVARLKTSKEALQMAENARAGGRPDLQVQALEYAKTLRAREEGYTTPAELAIANALYTYEEEQNRLKGRADFRANRLRGMLKTYGPIQTAERMALDPKRSTGFDVLEGGGRQDMTFEAIIVRHPDEFSDDALEAAHARLRGDAPPRRPRVRPAQVRVISEPKDPALTPAELDEEGKIFWTGFKNSKRFIADWLPRYKSSVQHIRQALQDKHPDALFETIWKTQDNAIAHAGVGLMKFDTVDKMRDDLVQVIREVSENGSADNFENIVARFESWRAEGAIQKVPRLLIARTFAGIHPDLYHTTVDIYSQNHAILWFVEHTGFVAPKSRSWAERALALTAHLSQIEEVNEDIYIRNMFCWFVAEQVLARKTPESFQPGHKPRAPVTTSDITECQRTIDLRHNRVQDALYDQLAERYGKDNVRTEHPTGTGGYADAVVRASKDEFHLYEIKIANTATEVVRQAMGQLLEYGFREGGLNPTTLFAVGEPALDEVTQEFIGRLQREFNLNLNYLRIEIRD